MKIIILYGLPAVGKLTIAKELSHITGYKIFHNHISIDFALTFFKFGTSEFVKIRNELWIKGLKIAKVYNFNGLILTTIFEKTTNPKLILNINKYFDSNDIVYYILLKCSKKELIKRVSSQERISTGKIHSLEQLIQVIETEFVYIPKITGKYTYEIDITKLHPSEAARLITKFIGGGGGNRTLDRRLKRPLLYH